MTNFFSVVLFLSFVIDSVGASAFMPSVWESLTSVIPFLSAPFPGYSGFDSYNGISNYCFGNGMFDERVRGERGGRGKVQTLFTLESLVD